MKLNKAIRKYFIITFIFLFLLLLEPFINLKNSASATDSQAESSKEVDFKRYYYNQLNSIEKAIYDNLASAKESLLNGENITIAIHPYNKNNKQGYVYYYTIIKRVIKAYTYDNPETELWLDNYKSSYYISEDYVYMKLTIIE